MVIKDDVFFSCMKHAKHASVDTLQDIEGMGMVKTIRFEGQGHFLAL